MRKKEEDFVFSVKAAYLSGLSHPLRLQILDQLRTRERPVGEIAQILNTAQPTISKHLALLRQQGIVSTRQSGVSVYYRLTDREVLAVLKLVSAILRKKLEKSRQMLAELSKERP
jgi:ArsR family transcriptional regulator